MHVGATNAIDIDYTIKRQRNVHELLNAVPADASDRRFFESDGPFLRGTPVKLRPGGAATISLQPPAAIATWSLRKARPGDTTGSTSRDIASGSGPIAFTVPSDAGTLVLRVDFAANVGTANYFWAFSPG